MLPEEYAAAGDLAGDGFDVAVGSVRDTHGAIAERVFASIGSAAEPIAAIHNAVANIAYGATQLIGTSLLRVAGRGVALARNETGSSIDQSPVGRLARGALSGAFGDTLSERGNPLVVTMAIRRQGRDVRLRSADLAAEFSEATPRLAVFVHGLCETDDAWSLGADHSRPYGSRLNGELGYTPVYVRYNSGLHISDNGRRLSALLDGVVEAWPTDVADIVLIGHSMGGLVARSAAHYAAETESLWPGTVRHVVSLGTPHHGAPLEQAAHAAGWALRRLPETRPLAGALNARSAGIKDLGRGYLTDECWAGQDPDVFLRRAAQEIPFLETANHYFVSASLTRDPDHPLGRYIGDLLVLHSSAWGSEPRGERMRFGVDHYRHYGGANHFDLLNHPAIGEQLVQWCSSRAPTGV